MKVIVRVDYKVFRDQEHPRPVDDRVRSEIFVDIGCKSQRVALCWMQRSWIAPSPCSMWTRSVAALITIFVNWDFFGILRQL